MVLIKPIVAMIELDLGNGDSTFINLVNVINIEVVEKEKSSASTPMFGEFPLVAKNVWIEITDMNGHFVSIKSHADVDVIKAQLRGYCNGY